VVHYHLVRVDQSADGRPSSFMRAHRFQRASDLRCGPGPRVTMTGPGVAGAPAVTRPRRVSRRRRFSEAGALRWQGQIARATRGRDLHLNVPFPRKPPDLLMAESPPTGGLSALTGPQPPPSCCAAPLQPSHAGPPSSILLGSDSNLADRRSRCGVGRISGGRPAPCGASVRRARPSRTRGTRKRRRTAADQGRMSFSVAVNRSPDSSSSPSMCRRAGPVSVHRSRK
jgi:hypothetical protein